MCSLIKNIWTLTKKINTWPSGQGGLGHSHPAEVADLQPVPVEAEVVRPEKEYELRERTFAQLDQPVPVDAEVVRPAALVGGG